MNGHSEIGIYETFEHMFGRRSSLHELVAEVGSFKQQSVLWVCAVIVTGMQLWNKIDLSIPGCVFPIALTLF